MSMNAIVPIYDSPIFSQLWQPVVVKPPFPVLKVAARCWLVVLQAKGQDSLLPSSLTTLHCCPWQRAQLWDWATQLFPNPAGLYSWTAWVPPPARALTLPALPATCCTAHTIWGAARIEWHFRQTNHRTRRRNRTLLSQPKHLCLSFFLRLLPFTLSLLFSPALLMPKIHKAEEGRDEETEVKTRRGEEERFTCKPKIHLEV